MDPTCLPRQESLSFVSPSITWVREPANALDIEDSYALCGLPDIAGAQSPSRFRCSTSRSPSTRGFHVQKSFEVEAPLFFGSRHRRRRLQEWRRQSSADWTSDSGPALRCSVIDDARPADSRLFSLLSHLLAAHPSVVADPSDLLSVLPNLGSHSHVGPKTDTVPGTDAPSADYGRRPYRLNLVLDEEEPMMSRPTRVFVDCSALEQNFNSIRSAVSHGKVLAVLKANAYGHGLIPVAKFLEAHTQVAYFGVAIPEEGIVLRKAGIRTPILVFGGILRNQIENAIRHDLTLTAHSRYKLDQINAVAESLGLCARVHLEIDTGMERVGVHWYKARPFIEHSLQCMHCYVEGIYSHFANSDSADPASTQQQLDRFMYALKAYDELGVHPPRIRHIANSGGILQLPESHLDMVRAGIVMYGVYPSQECVRPITVRPCFSVRSKVVYFKVVEENAQVSYGGTWTAPQQCRIVTVPIGYADGYPVAMSNKGQVIIRGKKYPVVGRVCMDQLMVNIDWDEAFVGDEVVLIGSQSQNGNRASAVTIEEVATELGTIPYEVLTGVGARVPRVYTYDNHVTSMDISEEFPV